MWRPYGAAICDDGATPKALDSNAPAGSKADVQLLLIEVLDGNTGKVWIVSSLAATPRTSPPVGVLFWLPAPGPTGLPPFIKLAIGVRPSAYYLVSEVPGEGAIISAYIA